MQFFILVLALDFFVFLYCVYLLANDDFIFLRRDVTMEKIFNIIFLGSLSSLFFSRLFYGLSHGGNVFANALVFLLFPYFPGLSLLGGVIGGGIVLLFLGLNKKSALPAKRLADFFSIALLVTLPIGFLGYYMFSENGISIIRAGSLIVSYLMLFVIFLRFLLPKLLSGKLKEGTITFLFLIFFAIISLASNAFTNFNILNYIKSVENILLILILLLSIGALFKYESLLLKLKEIRRRK